MNRYALYQSSRWHGKQITVSQTALPSHETADVAVLEVSHNPIYGENEFNFWLYSDKELDVKKVYKLFMALKYNHPKPTDGVAVITGVMQ